MAIIQRMMPDAIRWYDQNVSDVSRRYESVAAETVHGWLVDLLPSAPALVLDVGAGTGRDAAWLASRGLGSSRAGGREMISPPTRPGINPHGSLLEPLWNLFREAIFSLDGRRKESGKFSATWVVGAQGLEPWTR